MALLLWLKTLGRVDDLRRGQGLVEYAFLIILVGVVVVAILAYLAPGISNTYQDIIDQLNKL